MNQTIKSTIIVGLALFALVFGAGNMIFPVRLATEYGDHWHYAFLGFAVSELLITWLAFMVFNRLQSVSKLSDYLGKTFTEFFFFLFILILVIIILPRTAAVSYEMLIEPYFSSFPKVLFYSIYLLLCYLFILKPSHIINIIGKYLAPVIVLMISYALILTLFHPVHDVKTVSTSFQKAFEHGFFFGYQTGDAMAALIPWELITIMLIKRGFTDVKKRKSITFYASFINIILLTFVYLALALLGSSVSSHIKPDATTTEILQTTFSIVMGDAATFILSIITLFACFTTAIGVSGLSVNYLQSKTKLNYSIAAFIILLISFIISFQGVDSIIIIATPFIQLIYTIIILIIILHTLNIKEPIVHKWTVYTGSVLQILSIINAHFDSLDFLNKVLNYLPLSDQKMEWLIPSLIVLITIFSISKVQQRVKNAYK